MDYEDCPQCKGVGFIKVFAGLWMSGVVCTLCWGAGIVTHITANST